MKTNIFLFAISLLFISFACKKLNIEKELRIDFGTHFQNDFVTIKLDNEVVFSDNVSTNDLSGVSEVLIFDHPIGKYEISVSVNGIEKTDKFRHKKDQYIYISFDKPSSQIGISYPEETNVYD